MAIKIKWLKQLFVNNWGLKLLAIILAIVSFQAVRGVTSDTVRYDIPLTVEVGPGIAVDSQDPQSVKVMFRGSEEDLRRLEREKLAITITPKEINYEGIEEIVPILPKNVQSVPGVRVIKMDPAFATLQFDREIETPMRIAPPRIIGTPAVGKAEITYEPEAVVIRGPKRRMEDRKFVEVYTEPVDVSGRVRSFTKWIRVIPPREWVSQVDPSEISVKVKLVTESVSKVLTNVTIAAFTTTGDNKDIFFEPSGVNVSLHGRTEVLDGITANSVKVFVDCMDLAAPATYELPVNVHLPPGINARSDVKPKTIKVVIKER